MASDSFFALLTRGASLHKCKQSLASPLLQRREQNTQRNNRTEQETKKELSNEAGPSDSNPYIHRSKEEKQRKKNNLSAFSPSSCGDVRESADRVRQQYAIIVRGLADAPAPFLFFSDKIKNKDDTQIEIKKTNQETPKAHGEITEAQKTKWAPQSLPAWLVNRLGVLGYTQPTPIQMQAIPLLLQGHHVLASAPTGSGKTLAFLLPLIACLKSPRASFGRLVVLSPTRELARQSLRAFEKLTEGTGFKFSFPQIHTQGRCGAADAFFATPLSLLTLLKEERISLSDCEHLVLDEADRLLDSGFSPQIDGILSGLKSQAKDTRKRVQICLFSATLPPVVVLLAESIAYGVVHLAVGRASAAAPQIEQELVFCSTEAGKLWALKTLRAERKLIPPCLIFVATQERASELLKEMIGEGMAVDLLHAAKTKKQRDATVDAFRTGKIWFLICTDLVARGVDFKGVALVVNFDLPPSTAVYIHRIGRTGRAGCEGRALTFFTLDDVPRLRPTVQVMRKSSNSKIPDFLNFKLTRSLRVKGQKKPRGFQQSIGAPSRPRRPIRPKSKVEVLKAKRFAMAVAASKAKKKQKIAESIANSNNHKEMIKPETPKIKNTKGQEDKPVNTPRLSGLPPVKRNRDGENWAPAKKRKAHKA